MKKTIAMLLAVIMIMGMCVSLSACGTNKNDYVGIWKLDYNNEYMYLYKDGTGDYYGFPMSSYNPKYYGNFSWEVEDGYLVITTSLAGSTVVYKYTLSGDQLLDNKGKVYATKYSSDTSVDASFD